MLTDIESNELGQVFKYSLRKKIGKMLGITYNKEITMDVNNDLTKSLKSSIAENRREFNADASTSKNKELCDKAIKKNVINWRTCDIGLLSIKKWREERNKYDESLKPKPVSKVVEPVIKTVAEPVNKAAEPVHKAIVVEEEEPVNKAAEPVHKPIVEEDFPNPKINEYVIKEIHQPIIVEEVNEIHKPEEKTNKMILKEISKYIMEKIAENEQFDMSIESCVKLFDTVKKQLV
jgi:hypothetical protein